MYTESILSFMLILPYKKMSEQIKKEDKKERNNVIFNHEVAFLQSS
jgi:hypothetical protein